MPILNYTTNVPVDRTVGEVQRLLARAGAATVATTYQDGQPVGVSFVLAGGPGGDRGYQLPVAVDAVRQALLAAERRGEFRAAGKRTGTYTGQQHAARVAWRIAKDWLEAQVALIEARLAELDQVMLPYLQPRIAAGDDRTVYELYRDSAGAQMALANGASS